MFGDAFIEPEDLLEPGNTAILTMFGNKPKHCAADLELPDMIREGDFVGLRNQSATCYLNSLI